MIFVIEYHKVIWSISFAICFVKPIAPIGLLQQKYPQLNIHLLMMFEFSFDCFHFIILPFNLFTFLYHKNAPQRLSLRDIFDFVAPSLILFRWIFFHYALGGNFPIMIVFIGYYQFRNSVTYRFTWFEY